MKNLKLLVLTLVLQAISAGLHSQESGRETRVTLHSTVTGNQEQPRVMYIVPWDQPGELSIEHTLDRSIASELFMRVDREEFVRNLKYKSKMNTEKQGEDHGNL